MSTLNFESINTAKAVRESTSPYRRKILVAGFDVECIRFNKIVRIQAVRRLPKLHDDGRVTVRAFNTEYEVKAERVSLASDASVNWISFTV